MTFKMGFAFFMGLNLGLILLNIPPALTELMQVYQASYTTISLLISALLWSHALMQIPAGIITDRLGLKRSVFMCLAFMILGSLIPAAGERIDLAVAGRVVTGIGTGLAFVTTMKLIALHAPGGRIGTFQSFFAGAFSVGSILAFLVIPRLIPFGWQWAYLLPAVTCFALLVMSFYLGLSVSTAAVLQILPIGQVIRIRSGWILGIYHALSFGTVLNLGNWVPSLLAETWQGAAASDFGWGGVLVMLISGLGRLAGGFILLRLHPLLIADGSITFLAMIFSGLFIISTPPIVLCLALFAAWLGSVNFGAFFQLASQKTAPDSLGSFVGFINFQACLGAIFFTLAFGWAKDNFGSLSVGFAVLAFLCVIALFLGRIVFRQHWMAES